MKKQLIFDYKNSVFQLRDADEIIVSIPNDTLQLSAKDLYENLFSKIEQGENISLELKNEIGKKEDSDIQKKGTMIHKIMSELIQDISDEINNIKVEEDEKRLSSFKVESEHHGESTLNEIS